MSAHGIAQFNFEFWDEGPPQFITAQISTYNRPGSNNTGLLRQGFWAEPFTSVVRSWWPNYLQAMVGFGEMLQLCGGPPVQIKYNNINMLGVYSHNYFVTGCVFKGCKVKPRLVRANNLDYIGGAELTTEFTFVVNNPNL